MMPQCKNTVSFWPEGLFAAAVGEREGRPIVKKRATFNYVWARCYNFLEIQFFEQAHKWEINQKKHHSEKGYVILLLF
jgi:hypothetical protein